MFGINSFEQIGQIVEGHFKELTRQENALYDTRIKICEKCPLYTESDLGPICDSKKCWNEKEKEMSLFPNIGSVCGCGCRLQAKSRLKEAKCVLGKW